MINKDIKALITSKDPINRYLACCMLRNDDNNTFNYQTKKLLYKVNIFDRIKDYNDVCKELNIDELTTKDFKFLPADQRQKQLAYHKLLNIKKLLDTGKKTHLLWFPLFDLSRKNIKFLYSSWEHNTSARSHMRFHDKEVCKFVGRVFSDIYQCLYKK